MERTNLSTTRVMSWELPPVTSSAYALWNKICGWPQVTLQDHFDRTYNIFMNVLSIDSMHIWYFDYKSPRLTWVISLYYESNVMIHAQFNENQNVFPHINIFIMLLLQPLMILLWNYHFYKVQISTSYEKIILILTCPLFLLE